MIRETKYLALVVQELTRPCKNLNAKIWGLVFALGLDELNGISSQAEIAREIGCSRALISHYTREWSQKLNLKQFSTL